MDIYKYPPRPGGRSFKGGQPAGLGLYGYFCAGQWREDGLWVRAGPAHPRPRPTPPSEAPEGWLCAEDSVQTPVCGGLCAEGCVRTPVCGGGPGGFTHTIPWVLRRDSQRASLHCTFAEKKAGVRGIREPAILHRGVPQGPPAWEVADRSGAQACLTLHLVKCLIPAHRTSRASLPVQLQ